MSQYYKQILCYNSQQLNPFKMLKYLATAIIGITLLSACNSPQTTQQSQEEYPVNFINYSEANLEESFNNFDYTVLFFAADWCPTCIVAEENFLENADQIPSGVQILKADFDEETAMKKTYEVTIQHTFIQINENREALAKWSGGDIELMKQNLLVKDLSLEESEKAYSVSGSELPTIVQEVSLQNDYSTAKVPESEVFQGCFSGKDCIPSIDSPEFESSKSANTWLNDEDVVFGINIGGEQRAYAQRILNWHEIINDQINGQPIAVTFCPLCGSAVAFERIINGTITELGVSGKLHNSDLVMYDRFEGNLWQQITGEGIVGPAAERDEKLKQIPIATSTWGEWKDSHPDTLVLSIPTNFSRDYDAYPYGTYEENDSLLFGVEGLDESLQIKTVVYGVEIDGESKAYTAEAIKREKNIEDKIGETSITIEYLSSGEINFLTTDTQEEVDALRLFWFAWAAFHPDTDLYK
jgi:thiol-disulfide isomerase/thioredoxin